MSRAPHFKPGLWLAAFAASVGFAQQPAAPIMERDLSIVRLGSPDELKMPLHVPRGYAVVIGVSAYQNLPPQSNLAFAEKDAENFYSALISKEAGNIEWDNVRKLIGPQATLENIRDALEVWLPSKAQEGDRVVVFFVGHGVADKDGHGYLAPYDIDPQRLADTGYPMERLGETFSKKVKARWKMLLIDACHSGKIPIDSTTAARVNESLRGLPQGFLTLTSSRASEQSFEDPDLAGGNGVFSYFLVRGWQGEADVDPRDGVVTADELVTYVEREVRAYAKNRGAKQTPLEFGDFPDEMILGFSPNRREQLTVILPQLSNGGIVIEANLDSVEVYIDDQRRGGSSPGKPLRIAGLSPGSHNVRGVRIGYEPASVEVNVSPGSLQTVSLRLLQQRTVKPAAKARYDEAEAIWQTSKASPSDLRKASDLFARALGEDSQFSRAALGLCRVRQAQGETEGALSACRKAIEIDPDYVEARTMTGVLLMTNGDHAEAVRQLQKASTQEPSNSFVASLLAEAFFLVDRSKDAEEAANHAIELDSTSGQAYLMRGEARRAQKEFDKAIEDYGRVLRVQEFGSGVFRVAAFWTLGTGMQKHRGGYQFLYRSQKASAYYGLCASEIGRENYLRAVHYCRQSLAVERDDPDTHVLLAECYAGLFSGENRREYLVEARANIESSLRINPNIERAPELRRKLNEITELLGLVH